jgi:hypothetical protein
MRIYLTYFQTFKILFNENSHVSRCYLCNASVFMLQKPIEPVSYMILDTNSAEKGLEGLVQRDSIFSCQREGDWYLGLYICHRLIFGIGHSGIWDRTFNPDCKRTYPTNIWHHIAVTFKDNKT